MSIRKTAKRSRARPVTLGLLHDFIGCWWHELKCFLVHDQFLVSITHIGEPLPSGPDPVVDHAILLSLHHQGMAHYQHLFGDLVGFLFPPQPALSLCWLMLNLRPTLKPLDLFYVSCRRARSPLHCPCAISLWKPCSSH